MTRPKSLVLKILMDFICLLIVGIPILVFHLVGKPFERGYFCDDDSINYPYKDSTVTNVVLYIVGIFVPISIMCLVEFINSRLRVPYTQQRVELSIGNRAVPPLISSIYCTVGVFLFGACISQLATDIGKYSIGRLRPHFLSVCKPSNSYCPVDYTYVLNYTCTGNLRKIKEARLSFPSGHSSFSAYSMIYLALYLQFHMLCNTNRLLKPFLQTIALFAWWFTALSRVSDYKHHWSDVLAGSLLGCIVSLLVVFFISDLYSNKLRVSGYPLNSENSTTTNYNTNEHRGIELYNQSSYQNLSY